MSVVARLWIVALFGAACEGSANAPPSGEPDPARPVAVDRSVSTYKDPLPPNTAPPPGIDVEAAARARRELLEFEQFAIDGDTRREAIPGLRFRVPVEWERRPDASPAVARFILPGPGGDAELLVFGLEEGPQASTRQVGRWRAGFVSERGAPLGEADMRLRSMVRGPLEITLVDLGGALVVPDGQNLPHQRLFGAVLEGHNVRYSMAAVGPATTMALWEQAFADFAATFAVDPPPGAPAPPVAPVAPVPPAPPA